MLPASRLALSAWKADSADPPSLWPQETFARRACAHCHVPVKCRHPELTGGGGHLHTSGSRSRRRGCWKAFHTTMLAASGCETHTGRQHTSLLSVAMQTISCLISWLSFTFKLPTKNLLSGHGVLPAKRKRKALWYNTALYEVAHTKAQISAHRAKARHLSDSEELWLLSLSPPPSV